MTKLKKLIRPVLDIFYPNRRFSIKEVEVHDSRLLIYADQHTGRKISLGRFHRPETEFLRTWIQADDVCLDIGANVGYFSLLFASRGAAVEAFDPVPEHSLLLKLTKKLNPSYNIMVRQVAVSDAPGELKFHVADQTSLSKLTNQKLDNNELLSVNVITIDSLELDKVSFVKIDIEGAELSALKGMSETLNRCNPRLMMIELADVHLQFFESSVTEVIAYLNAAGYKVKILKKGILVPFTGDAPPNNNYFFEWSKGGA